MSHISQLHVYYPKTIVCEIKKTKNQSILWISGDYGTWFYKLSNIKYKISVCNNQIRIETNRFYSVAKYYYGDLGKFSMPILASQLSLLSILFKRMIVGAGVGFKKYLRVRGVGYKFELENLALKAKVGYTHTIQKTLPSEFFIRFSRKFKVIRLRSKSLTRLTSLLCSLRSFRKPDIYKGKGIRYKGDPVRRKLGKRKTKAVSKKKKAPSKKVLNLKKKSKIKANKKKAS